MRRTKEGMLITRARILKAGFDCFYNNGYEQTSLVAIAQAAGVTRGAIYWHFEDKKELFRAVVDDSLARCDITAFTRSLPPKLEYTERMTELFWYAVDDNVHVDFLFKALNFVSFNPEFVDVAEKIQAVKRDLWEFILMETNGYLHKTGGVAPGTEYIASVLYLMFEGIFNIKNIQIGIKLDKEEIYKYTHLVTASLILSIQSQRWERLLNETVG